MASLRFKSWQLGFLIFFGVVLTGATFFEVGRERLRSDRAASGRLTVRDDSPPPVTADNPNRYPIVFVRTGLDLEVEEIQVDPDGTVHATFTIADEVDCRWTVRES